MDSSFILLQLVLYYKVRHGLLQIATDVTKSYDYYSWRKKRFNLNKFLSLSFKGKTYRKPAWYNWSHRTNFIHKTRHLSMWIRYTDSAYDRKLHESEAYGLSFERISKIMAENTDTLHGRHEMSSDVNLTPEDIPCSSVKNGEDINGQFHSWNLGWNAEDWTNRDLVEK